MGSIVGQAGGLTRCMALNRWSIAMTVVTVVSLGTLAVATADTAMPMNIVVLVADDVRWDSLGMAGNEVIHTPRLDELCRQGVRFSQARVTTSICMTSRASILTGQYMSRHGIDRFGKRLSPEAIAQTYPALLRDAGYHTGFIGKYGIGVGQVEDFDVMHDYSGRHWYPDGQGERVHVTERNTRDAIAYLRQRPIDRPFCLNVSFFAPHAEDNARQQYLPQPWSAEHYAGVQIPVSPLQDTKYLKALPPFLAQPSNEGRIRFHWRFDTPQRYQQYMINYYRLITEVDEAVGRIVDELKHQGVYDNTLIIFIGDNGYFHGERGLADKWYPYEQALRVPLIVFDPRLEASQRGAARDELVLNIDVAPTILAAAGVEAPKAMQGRDMSPLYLAEDPPAWRDEFFYEHPTISNKNRIPTSYAVVRRDMKYVFWPEFDYEQLFDLKADPTELLNLADNPAHADTLRQFREKLHAWRESVR